MSVNSLLTSGILSRTSFFSVVNASRQKSIATESPHTNLLIELKLERVHDGFFNHHCSVPLPTASAF